MTPAAPWPFDVLPWDLRTFPEDGSICRTPISRT